MKRYVMMPPHQALVYNDADKSQKPLRNSPHGRAHSPTGFSWGYHGSGPAALAASILWDCLGNKAKCPHCTRKGRSKSKCWRCGRDGAVEGWRGMYQNFKAEVVGAHGMNETWSITEGEVMLWVQKYLTTHPQIEMSLV